MKILYKYRSLFFIIPLFVYGTSLKSCEKWYRDFAYDFCNDNKNILNPLKSYNKLLIKYAEFSDKQTKDVTYMKLIGNINDNCKNKGLILRIQKKILSKM